MQLTLTPETSDYIGWVPCLNGQLVFDLVECGLKKKNHGSIEIIYRAKDSSGSIIEYILVHSTVDWKDFGGNEVDGLWSVVLISKRSLKSNYHEGVVCFMPKSMQEMV